MEDSKRLFIGIELNQLHKENLSETNKRLKMYLKSGDDTKKENFHITLKFLGETKVNRIPVIEEVMENVAGKVQLFLASMGEVDEFRKGNRSTLWMGIKGQEELQAIHGYIEEELEKLFYKKDPGTYVPHITLVRNAELNDGVEDLEALRMKLKLPKLPILMDKLVLFESLRQEDGMKYVNIYEVPLLLKRQKELQKEALE